MFQDETRDSFLGEWWQPESPNVTFMGTLDIAQSLDLRLYESTDSAPRTSGDEQVETPILHGRSMGSCLTLLDNTETWMSTTRRSGRLETQRRFSVGTALVGSSHVGTVENCRFNRASLRLTSLDEWVSRSPYKWTNTPTDSVAALDLPVLQASIPGCEIRLGRRTASHLGHNDSGFTSHEVIELHLEERHALDELEYRFIRPLQQLLTLATKSHCEVLELRVGNTEPAASWDTTWPFTFYTLRRTSSDMAGDRPMVIRPNMRFGMNCLDIPPNIDFCELFPRWFALQDGLSSVCDLIFSLRTDRAGYLQQQMFTIASAIEGLHRGLNPHLEEKTPAQRDRNKQILRVAKAEFPEHHQWLAGAIQFAHRRPYVFRVRDLLGSTDHLMETVVGDEAAWTQQLRAMRDGIGHVLPSEDAKSYHQMVAMLDSARLLAEMVLLRQLGFTDAECRSSLEHGWERQNIRARMIENFQHWFTSRE